MAKSVGAFARDCQHFGDDLRAADKQATHAAALMMTTAIRRNMRKIVPDSQLSGATSIRQRRKGGSAGAKLSVGFNVRQTKERTTALISANGPWPLIESDTPKHGIPKKAAVRYTKSGRVAKSRMKARKRLMIPGVGVRSSAQHPGTTGQKPFARGRDATKRKVPKEYQKAVAQAMVKRFG